jgi:hypothetical protein
MEDGKIGNLTHKPPISKEELGEGSLGIIRRMNTKTLPPHSTFTYYSAVQGSFKGQRLLVEMSMIK